MDRVIEAHARTVLSDVLAPVADLLVQDNIQEILTNGDGRVWAEVDGQLVAVPDRTLDVVRVRNAIEVIARLARREPSAETKDAIVDARLSDGSRFCGVLHPVSIRGHAFAVRRHARRVFSLEDYRAMGAFDPVEKAPDPTRSTEAITDLGAWLKAMVKHRKSILVSGGTSTGKTTFLNALLAELPNDERIITIEDTPELQVLVENRLGLEANPAAGIGIRDLVRAALRLRPDRIVVGEVRGAEAFDLMQALNTGHDGGMATIHANSAKAALTRLETLVQLSGVEWPMSALKPAIAQTFDAVVHLARLKGRRRVLEVVAIDGFDGQDYRLRRLFG